MTAYKAFSFGGVALAASIVAVALSTDSRQAQACPAEPYLGAVCFTAATYCPPGWVAANAQALTINGNEALYSVIGTVYGTSEPTNFLAPDLRGRIPLGAGTGTGLIPRVLGQTPGTEGTIMTPETLPAHTHTATFTGTPSVVSISATVQASGTQISSSAVPSAATPVLGVSEPLGLTTKKMWAATAGTVPVAGTSLTVSALPPAQGGPSVTNSNTGSSAVIANAPPQLALMPCVATTGIYPVKP